MPSQSSNQTALRAPGHKVRAYAAFFLGASVLTGTVSATPAESAYPITTIAYTTSTGSSANVRRGYRVIIKTAAGVFKFACTVRNSGTISSVALPIRESSRGSVRVVSGDLIEVRSIIQPGDKLTAADATFAPDGLAYSNQNSVISPVCCSGGAWAGFVDSGQTYATVAFVGSTSYTLDEDSSGTVTHLWTFSTATGTTTSTSADPSFTFPVGEHTGTHVVTDTSNSATATQVIAVKVFDDTTLPYDILLDSPPRIDIASGASCSIELFSSATLTDIPDGTMVCIFMRETINGVQTSYGSATTGRSHILMTGYTNGDTVAYSDGLDTLTMDIVSPLKWYGETLGLSKVGLRESSPDSWQEIEGLTCWMMCIQILRWYTWLMDSWDVTLHPYLSDEDYPALFISEQDAISQVRELVHGLGGRFVELRHGWFQAQPRLEMLTRAHRLLQPTTLTHGDDDIESYEFSRDHRRRVARARMQGFRSGGSTSTAKPMFAVWPGDAPGSGTTQETIDKQIRFSPSDFFEAAGHIGAELDRVYVVTDGSGNVTAVHHAPRGTLTIHGYFVYDLYAEWQAFDSSMASNLRGVALSDFRWIIEAIDYEISDEGVPTTTLDIKAETFGDPAVDDTPPAEETSGLPDYNLPDIDFGTIPQPGVIGGVLPVGTGVLGFMSTDGNAYDTSNFDNPAASGGPTYTADALAAAGMTGSFLDAVVDAFSPGYPGGGSVVGGAVNGWGVSTTGIFTWSSFFGTLSITMRTTFAAVCHAAVIQTERAVPNSVVVHTYTNSVGSKAWYSTNGTTFTASAGLPTHYDNSGNTHTPTICMYGRTANLVRVICFTNTAAPGSLTTSGYESTDGGANFSIISSPNLDAGQRLGNTLQSPYDAPTVHYLAHATYSGGVYTYTLRKTSGASQTDISPTVSATKYAPSGLSQRDMRFDDADPNKGILIGRNNNNTDVTGVFTTRNGGTSWTTAVTPHIDNYNRFRSVALVGNKAWFGGQAQMWYTNDFMATYDDRTGTGLGAAGHIPNIWGGGA